MPFVSNMPTDEEQKAPSQGAVPATGGAPVQLTPSSGVVGAGTPTTPSSTATPAGGQFASLNQYLAANQGQAMPLANKLTSSVNKEYSNLDAANNAAIANIAGQVANAPGYTPNSPETMTAEAANPVSFTQGPGNVQKFQSLLQNTYGGPVSAESTSDYANRQSAINRAIAQGQDKTATEAGREGFLSENEAAPSTSVTALNSAILSQDPNALASVESAYKPFQNLVTGLQSGAQDVNKQIAKETADAAASSKAAQDAITSQINALNTGVTGELTSAQQNAAQQNAALKAALTSGTPSDANLKALGITSDQWNALSAAQKAAATSQLVTSNKGQFNATSGTTNLDLSNFLTQTNPNAVINAANVATPQDYAKAQAFQTLLGGLNLGTPATIINPTTASQAATAPTNLSRFDYQTALNTAQAAKTEELAAAQAYVDALQSGADEEHAQLAAKNAAKKSAALGLSGIAETPLAATEATGVGAVGAAKNIGSQFSTPRKALTNIAENILTGGLSTPVKAVASGVSDAVNTVTSIFCFHPDTLVEMAGGSLLPIHAVAVGDITKGGKVMATTRAIGSDFYWYNGVIVTAKHAVKENGVWVRVENSKFGHKFKYLTEVVCNLVTENHRIYANGIEFADQHETDLYESLDMDESLRELNRNAVDLG